MLLTVDKHHTAVKVIGNPARHPFGTIDRTVLTASAAETDAEIGKVTFEIVSYRCPYHGLCIGEEGLDQRVTLQILDDRQVATCIRAEFGFTAGIGQSPAVEDKTAPIARCVLRQSLLVGEAGYGDGERGVLN